MNDNIHNFLILLGNSVNGTSVGSLIRPVEWAEIFGLAEAHNVYALVFESASEVPEFLQDQDYNTYMLKAIALVASQAKRTEAFLELYHVFTEKNLHPIVMKGIVCRSLYGEYCDHRPSGDEDILIPKSEFETVKAVLEEQGYIAEHKTTTPQQLDELQEITFYESCSDFHIELHVNPFGRENTLRRRMNDCFSDVFDHPRKLAVDDVELWTMDHTDHFVFLALHAFKHLTGAGVGIRQVLDIMLYDKQYRTEIDWDCVKEKLQALGAYRVLEDMIHIGNCYLGFDVPELCTPSFPDALLNEMIHCGVFGNETQAQRTATQMTMSVIQEWGTDIGKGKAAVLLRTLFPSKARMINVHPELQEKPWLLPIRWAQRWGRFIQHSKNTQGSLAKESMEISRRRIELLQKYKIL